MWVKTRFNTLGNYAKAW